MRSIILGSVAATALAAGALAQDDLVAPAGAYSLDKNHASITWRVNHLGTSNYVARFDEFDAELTFDPDNPTESALSVTIDVTSLSLDFSNPDNPDSFYDELMGYPTEENEEGDQRFFRATQFPTISFEATGMEVTGENTGTVTGDLSFMGQTHPLTLDVTYNGVRQGFGGGAPVIGFSGTTTVTRSEWGMDAAVPFIGDEVEVWVEAEFVAPSS